MINTRRDPTRSLGLRRSGRVAVNRRVFELHKRLRMAFQEQDLVGLRQREGVSDEMLSLIEGNANRIERSEWMVRKIVEETLATPPDWLRALIERSVQRGVDQVGQELKIAVEHLDPAEVSDFHAAASAVEVKGIAGETQRRVLRGVIRAVEAKQTPDELMREVRQMLHFVTKKRLLLLINTAVVRAVNAGKLFGYKLNGVRAVGIEPEWLPGKRMHDHMLHDRKTRTAKVRARKKANKARRAKPKTSLTKEILKAAIRSVPGGGLVDEPLLNVLTAGDDKVCEDCTDIAADGPYTLIDAAELIPAHPNCRCAFIPWGDARFAPIEEQEEEE